MPRLLALLAALPVLAGCAGALLSTPVVSCADAGLAAVRLAADVDTPPEPVGGLHAVQDRVRIPNEGVRIAAPGDRFAVVRAVVDTSGAVRCSDVVMAGTEAKGEAARRAIHQSAFTPGRLAGQPVAVAVDLRLDVRGEGRTRVISGNPTGM